MNDHGPLAHLLPPHLLGSGVPPLPPLFDVTHAANLESSPWSHGGRSCKGSPVFVQHIVPPDRTRSGLMREALRRVRDRESEGEGGEDLSTFLARTRPRASEDTFDLGPLPAGWKWPKPPTATLVNSVYGTICEGAVDGFHADYPTLQGKHATRGVSFLALQQRLLGILHPAPIGTSGYLFCIKFRPLERATHRFNPMDTSFQTVGVASDIAGSLTSKIMAQLVGTALDLERFVDRRSACHNRVFTIFLPFNVQNAVFEAANPHLVDQPMVNQCTVALSPQPGNDRVKLLIFPSGVIICVGAKTTHDMSSTMALALPLLYQARVMDTTTTTSTGSGPASNKKRKATESAASEEKKKMKKRARVHQ